jgi:hypothetical protein
MHAFSAPYDYCGIAIFGSLTSSAVWKITRIQINSDGSNTITTATNVKWNDYLVVTHN